MSLDTPLVSRKIIFGGVLLNFTGGYVCILMDG